METENSAGHNYPSALVEGTQLLADTGAARKVADVACGHTDGETLHAALPITRCFVIISICRRLCGEFISNTAWRRHGSWLPVRLRVLGAMP